MAFRVLAILAAVCALAAIALFSGILLAAAGTWGALTLVPRRS